MSRFRPEKRLVAASLAAIGRIGAAAALVAITAFADPVAAQPPLIDRNTDLALDCGAAYLLNAAYEKDGAMAGAIRTAGTEFMTSAGNVLAAKGMSDAELKALGRDRTLAVAEKIKAGTPLAFSDDDCQKLLADIRNGTARPAAAPAESAALEMPQVSEKADKLLSCAAAYLVASSGAGEDTKAKSLRQIATTIGGLADKELEAGGFTDEQIATVGKQYGVRIAQLIKSGKPLPYSWEACAKLAF